MLPKTSLIILTVIALLVLVACSISLQTQNKMSSFDELTPADHPNLMLIELRDRYGGSGDTGIYWFNVDTKSRYQALQPLSPSGESVWIPEVSQWDAAAQRYIYGHRVYGYYILHSDGLTQTHSTYTGRGILSQDGTQLLQYENDCQNRAGYEGYQIVDLTTQQSRNLFCLPANSSLDQPYFIFDPFWDGVSPTVNTLILRQQTGGNNSLEIEAVTLATAAEDGTITHLTTLPNDLHLTTLKNEQLSPNGRYLALNLPDDSLAIYDTQTGAEVAALPRPFSQITWSRNSETVATVDRAFTLTLYHLPSQTDRAHYLIPPAEHGMRLPKGFLWSPNDTHLALYGQTNEEDKLILVDANTGSYEIHSFDRKFTVEKIYWLRQ